IRPNAAGRLAFLDQRGAIEARTRRQRVAVVHRARQRADAFEQYLAGGVRLRCGVAAAIARSLDADVLARRDAGEPPAQGFDRRVLDDAAEAFAIALEEGLAHSRQMLGRESRRRQRDRDLKALPN